MGWGILIWRPTARCTPFSKHEPATSARARVPAADELCCRIYVPATCRWRSQRREPDCNGRAISGGWSGVRYSSARSSARAMCRAWQLITRSTRRPACCWELCRSSTPTPVRSRRASSCYRLARVCVRASIPGGRAWYTSHPGGLGVWRVRLFGTMPPRSAVISQWPISHDISCALAVAVSTVEHRIRGVIGNVCWSFSFSLSLSLGTPTGMKQPLSRSRSLSQSLSS